MEGRDDAQPDELGGGGGGGANPLAAASRDSKGAEPLASPASDSPGGAALKVAAAVLHPVCLGDGPLMLPIHLQVGGATGAQLGQMGAAPYLIASQTPVSLPLVLAAGGPRLQADVLCQNPFASPPPLDHKTAGQTQDANLLSLLQNPAFAAILQDLFPPQAGAASACQSPGSAFFPLPPLAPSYASPLAPLVPPATLLVPYPVIIPLPVPLPLPLPVPVPAPPAEDSKGNMPKPVCTASKSTQTSPRDAASPPAARRLGPSLAPRHAPPPPSSLPGDDGQALDLSVRACPVVLKQEDPGPQQDDVLDLSVPVRRKCVQSDGGVSFRGGPGGAASLSLGVDSKLLGGLASLDFSRQHRWAVGGAAGGSGALGQQSAAGNPEAAKVIVSVKDAIPAVLCGKIKGLSGVSTKNFSIKRDGGQAAAAAASLQQLYGVPVAAHDPDDPQKKLPKNRTIKLKKVGSEIHFLPIKKQRLAALLPRK
ncbi:retinoic acid-induced protein 2-like [Pseudoliparis swirei]|uniref:retinoic acid-induced protein 2-like n=1 Tax=Pseudoliparis swirei TaxID=2059687 RepID=UPI0024BE977D|nr:retinoic acid-induced protein 2-like [Pseudoliparis swirei]XP_056270708.1 retinoic acid-induced protein 2-like [Pseudoliparis swirei]